MKKFLNIFKSALIYVGASLFSLHASHNHVFNCDEIFEIRRDGSKATRAVHTTRAHLLHREGIKGKGLLAAVIDSSFHPKYTDILRRKGLIHPAAFSENLIFDPDDNLENVDADALNSQRFNLRYFAAKTTENTAKIKKLDNLWYKKIRYDAAFKSTGGTHGSGVMEALHQIAPEAQLLPIDTVVSSDPDITWDGDTASARAIRKAIQYGANVINISSQFSKLSPELLEACKEATRRGIVLIISAGNDSCSLLNYFLDEMWDQVKNVIARNPKQDLFDKLGGKGIRFAGALEYDNNGEEKVTGYTQHPSQNTQKHFIFTAGSHLPVHSKTDPYKLTEGTSFAAPTVTGGYLLELEAARRQAARDKKPPLSPDQILNIIYDSGRNVRYQSPWSWWTPDKIYKSMDLWSAKQTIERKVAPKPVMPKKVYPKVKTPAKKVVENKKAARKVVANKTATKKVARRKPAVKKKVRRKSTVRKVARRKSTARTVVRRKSAVRKVARRKPTAKKVAKRKPAVRKTRSVKR